MSEPENAQRSALLNGLAARNIYSLGDLEGFEEPRCQGCGGPHPFDTSVPSPAWNRVIRDGGLPDYLCTTCIVAAFVRAGESFEAELYGAGLNDGGTVQVIRVQVDERPFGEPVVGNCPECDAPIGDGVPGCVHWPSEGVAEAKAFWASRPDPAVRQVITAEGLILVIGPIAVLLTPPDPEPA